MHLPLKFLPRVSQQVAELIGGGVLIGMGIVFLMNYLPDSSPAPNESFGAWLAAHRGLFPFLALSTGIILGGLYWLTVAVINIAGGSPFAYIVVDRFGITHRSFWSERRYAWKNLGPVSAYHAPVWQARRGQRRYWIIADTVGDAEDAGGGGILSSLFFGRPIASLRIPAATYVANGFLSTSLGLAAGDAAGWLETLRQIARNDLLDREAIPPLPDCFRQPIALDDAVADRERAAPTRM